MIKEFSLSISQLLGISTTIAVLVALCICALWTIWLNRIKEGQKAEFEKHIEKYKMDLAKELESFKTKNQNTNYISKVQFDAEFKMYQELSASSFEAIMTLRVIGNEGYLGDLQKEYNENWETKSLERVHSFATTIYKYAPFIEEKFFVKLNDLAKQINDINNSIEFDNEGKIVKNDTLIEAERNVLNNQQNLIADLRNYLRTLRVIEDK